MYLLRFLLVFSFFSTTLSEANIKIGISTATNYVGDREIAWRIKIAANRLGWKVFLDEDHGRLIQNMQLDWVICMLPDNQFFHPHCPNYLMVFHPFKYLNEKRDFHSFYKKYDGYFLNF